jgi:hypothetical protein
METHLQAVTTIRLPINHVQNLILHCLAHSISRRPIVTGTCAFLVHIKVLRVVDVAVGTIDDTIDHSRLEIQHNCARDVARVVGLVEKDVLAIAASVRALGGIWVKITILVNTVLEAELLPEL